MGIHLSTSESTKHHTCGDPRGGPDAPSGDVIQRKCRNAAILGLPRVVLPVS